VSQNENLCHTVETSETKVRR